MEHHCPTCQQPMKQTAATLKLAPENWHMDASGLVVKFQPVFDCYCATCDYSEIRTQDGNVLVSQGDN